jgi:hypothetical protein
LDGVSILAIVVGAHTPQYSPVLLAQLDSFGCAIDSFSNSKSPAIVDFDCELGGDADLVIDMVAPLFLRTFDSSANIGFDRKLYGDSVLVVEWIAVDFFPTSNSLVNVAFDRRMYGDSVFVFKLTSTDFFQH